MDVNLYFIFNTIHFNILKDTKEKVYLEAIRTLEDYIISFITENERKLAFNRLMVELQNNLLSIPR